MQLNFIAYSGDCRLAGHVRLEHDRLSDLLNGDEDYLIREVVMESLADGHRVTLPELALRREELCAVEGLGPRGNRGRRIGTRLHRMQLQVGPYLVAGHLHALPGVDPLACVVRRGPFLALTDVTLAYGFAGESQLRDAAVILVNRELVSWIRPVASEALAFPKVPVKLDPYAKDLTAELYS